MLFSDLSTRWQHAPICSFLSQLIFPNAFIVLRAKILSQDMESVQPDLHHNDKTGCRTVPKLSDVMSMTPESFPTVSVRIRSCSLSLVGRGGGRGEILESRFHREEILSTQTRSANPFTHPHTHSLFITLALYPLDQKQLGPYVRLLFTLTVLFPVWSVCRKIRNRTRFRSSV